MFVEESNKLATNRQILTLLLFNSHCLKNLKKLLRILGNLVFGELYYAEVKKNAHDKTYKIFTSPPEKTFAAISFKNIKKFPGEFTVKIPVLNK